MEDIAEGARRVLSYIENNGSEDRYITGYARAVRQFALNAQRGDGQGMAKVLEALTKINADTERLNQRIDTIEKTTSILSTNVSTSAANSAAACRDFRAKDWQRGLAKAAAPNTRSNGTSSPGVPEIELREDREVIVKVGPNREQIRGLSPRELVERAERQKASNARQKNSAALAGGATFVAARKLPSGDVVMVANSAAGAELLRKHPEWLRAFGPGSVIQEPSWGVVAYHIPVKSMKLTPETMADVSAELLRQNDWGEGAKIQYLGWLTRPGIRAEGPVLIEFTATGSTPNSLRPILPRTTSSKIAWKTNSLNLLTTSRRSTTPTLHQNPASRIWTQTALNIENLSPSDITEFKRCQSDPLLPRSLPVHPQLKTQLTMCGTRPASAVMTNPYINEVV